MAINKRKQLKNIKKIVRNYASVLENNGLGVEQVYLYGSYARGIQRAGSDIDVCVVLKNFNPNKDQDRFLLWNKVCEVDYRIEPVGFHASDFIEADPLVYEIKKYGIKIK